MTTTEGNMMATTESTEGHGKIIFADETYLIRGAIFEVYKELGSDFLEAVYQECLHREFTLRGIPFTEQSYENHIPHRKNLTAKRVMEISILRINIKIEPVYTAQGAKP